MQQPFKQKYTCARAHAQKKKEEIKKKKDRNREEERIFFADAYASVSSGLRQTTPQHTPHHKKIEPILNILNQASLF